MQPLAGIRATEVTGYLAGPVCGLHLAHLGAEVVRVEPITGDKNREYAPFLGPRGVSLEPQTPEDISVTYLLRAAGRRSITLDLKSDQGRDLFKRLAAQVDVVIENLSPGATSRLGIDYPVLRELNPRIVYAAITGFGQSGPYRDYPAVDPIIQAMSGLMSLIGEPDGPPMRTGVFYLADQVAAVFGVVAILSALRQRDLTGEGQFLDVPLLDCLLSMLWLEPLGLYRELGLALRTGNSASRLGPFDVYPTIDGWLLIVCPGDGDWVALTRAIERPDCSKIRACGRAWRGFSTKPK